MAFIATYISTVSGGSELSKYFEEISEWTSTDDVTAHETAIMESYDYVNSKLDAYLQVPVAKEPSTGRYHPLVRFAQAMRAIYLLIGRKQGWASERAVKAQEAYAAAEKEMLEARSQFEWQTSPDEMGIGRAIPALTNTSTATFVTNRSVDYTGNNERTYTITITLAGAIGTATFSWADGEGNTHTGNTTGYDWIALEDGLYVRCMDAGDSFIINNTWTIRCVPATEPATEAAGSIGNIEIRR